jgi:hypothetical protein
MEFRCVCAMYIEGSYVVTVGLYCVNGLSYNSDEMLVRVLSSNCYCIVQPLWVIIIHDIIIVFQELQHLRTICEVAMEKTMYPGNCQ